ncbi:hypothetical protein QYF36_012689 [Acer negundo]|nr:hypothetical protein QYF36_012689 [Acer negundo]
MMRECSNMVKVVGPTSSGILDLSPILNTGGLISSHSNKSGLGLDYETQFKGTGIKVDLTMDQTSNDKLDHDNNPIIGDSDLEIDVLNVDYEEKISRIVTPVKESKKSKGRKKCYSSKCYSMRTRNSKVGDSKSGQEKDIIKRFVRSRKNDSSTIKACEECL